MIDPIGRDGRSNRPRISIQSAAMIDTIKREHRRNPM
jgi:hypothetical protein